MLLFITETLDAKLLPSDTVALVWKLLPEIVIDVPPAEDPEFGVTVFTTGAGGVGLPQGSMGPVGDQPLFQRHHCESVPSAYTM